jgi:AraC family transcriptional regulator
MGVTTRIDAAAIVLPGSTVTHLPKPTGSGEPEVAVGQERSWGGVSVCETDLRWSDGGAQHEITCEQAVLWVIAEQVGGRYEHRTDPSKPLVPEHSGQHVMSLVPPGMELWGYARKIRFVRSLRLTFDPGRAGLSLGNRRLEPAFATPRLMFTSDSLWQIVSLLIDEYRAPHRRDALYGESIATALCVELLRLGATGKAPATRSGLAPWQMNRVVDYTQTHLCDPIPLSDFAQLVGMSRSYFSHAFHRTTGMPPHRWHLHMRILRAQELLLDTTLPLAEIALRTGFADQSHFTKNFRRQVGVSPGAWRRNRRS